MLKSARCSGCKTYLPLSPALLSFRSPPREVTCPGCGATIETSLPYRITWMGAVLWKHLSILILALCLAPAHGSEEMSLLGALIFALVLSLIVAGPFAYLFAIPVQIILMEPLHLAKTAAACRPPERLTEEEIERMLAEEEGRRPSLTSRSQP